MSGTKSTVIERQLSVASGTIVGTTLTLVFTANHYLKVGDVVSYRSQYRPSIASLTVASVVDPTSITATVTITPETSYDVITGAVVIVPYYSTGQTGRQPSFSFPAYDTVGILQFVMSGTGGATFTLSGSLDNSTWTDLATITLAGTNGANDFIAISVPWSYLSINISSIGASSSLKIIRMG